MLVCDSDPTLALEPGSKAGLSSGSIVMLECDSDLTVTVPCFLCHVQLVCVYFVTVRVSTGRD